MPKTIHYRHPRLGYHACGMGDIHKVKMTDRLEEVTCKRCQNTVTGSIGRPKGYTPSGNAPMVKFTCSVFMSEELLEWYKQQPDRAALLRRLLEAERERQTQE